MALVLGDLAAIISADDRPFEEGLDQARTKFQKFGDKLQAAGALAGAAIGAALAVGIAGALEMEAANDKLAAQLGLSAAESERMGKIAGDLYADAYGESLGQVNDAIAAITRNLGQLGDDELKEISAAALNLASAFDVDVAESTRAVSKLIKTGLATNAEEAFDILTRGFQGTANEADDLLDTFSEYSTQFRALGVSGKQALGLIEQGLAGGARDGDVVADTIKEINDRVLNGDAAAGLKAIGLNAKQMAADFAAGGPRANKALDTIFDRLRTIKDPAERAKVAAELLGEKWVDLQSAAFALDPSSAVEALGKIDGANKQLGDTLSDNANTKLTMFKRQVQAVLVEKLAEVVPYIEATFGWLSRNSEWVTPLATGLGILAGAIVVASGAMKVWAVVQTILNLALWTSPITWIVVAVIALVAGIVLLATHTKEIGELWDVVWGGITDAALWAWGKIKAAAAAGWAYLQNVWSSFLSLPEQLGSAFSKIAGYITAPFRAAFNAVARLWNGTIGALHWSVPGWVPFIGGNSISAPKLPQLARGGYVPATPGGRLVNVGEGGQGEIVAPESKLAALLDRAVAAGARTAGGAAAAGGTGERVRDVILMVDGEVIERRTLRAIDGNSERVALAVRAGDKSLAFAD
ncbi:phage tail tape measure protein [Dactylosporangium sp. NBC_01737]|uniref:phage tail tape measure protein n=1 Tax=Dactylosporangium sp. NBC_01737 TaxID=2975959 RepID=UPI002E101DF7|nr:phage tail tape measure protein [Dactylosporangium sp. NBC_01737]